MRQLALQLADLPAEERQAALDYYAEYLDEAGPENEADALRMLGDPAEIAAEIRGGHTQQTGWDAGYTGKGGSYGTCLGDDAAGKKNSENDDPTADFAADGPVYREHRPTDNGSKVWLLLLLCTCPLWFGAAGVLLGVVMTVFAVVVTGIALAVSGVAVGVASIPLLGSSFGSGLVNIGIALLLAALGLVLLSGCWWVCTTGIPALVQGIRNLIETIKRKVNTL